MGHHHREDPDPTNPSQPADTVTNGNNPFLGASDITYLSMIIPLLSESGKQVISFFVNFGNNKPSNSSANDPISLLKQLAPKIENSGLREILPSILTMLSNQDYKGNSTPLASVLPTNPAKKEDDGLK